MYIQRREQSMVDLRVAENGPTRPCTVLILACAGSASPLPVLAAGAVVGRYILIGILRRGVPGGLSSLLWTVLNLARLSVFLFLDQSEAYLL